MTTPGSSLPISVEGIHKLATEQWPKDLSGSMARKYEWLGRVLTSQPTALQLTTTIHEIGRFVKEHPEVLKDKKVVDDLFVISEKLSKARTMINMIDGLSEYLLSITCNEAPESNVDLVKVRSGASYVSIPRTLLTLKSSYFEAFLKSNDKEAAIHEITLDDDFDQSVNDNLLVFLVEGEESKFTKENIFDTMKLAKKYELGKLFKMCEDWLVRNHPKEKMEDLWSLASDDKLELLQYKTVENALSNFLMNPIESSPASQILQNFGSRNDISQLNLSFTQVNNSTLDLILKKFPHVKSLNISKCPNIKDGIILIIANRLPGLEVLDISDSSNITEKSFGELKNELKKLRVLTISHELGEREDYINIQISELSSVRPNLMVNESYIKPTDKFKPVHFWKKL